MILKKLSRGLSTKIKSLYMLPDPSAFSIIDATNVLFGNLISKNRNLELIVGYIDAEGGASQKIHTDLTRYLGILGLEPAQLERIPLASLQPVIDQHLDLLKAVR